MGSSRTSSRSPSPPCHSYKKENGAKKIEIETRGGKSTKKDNSHVGSSSEENSNNLRPTKLEIYCIVEGEVKSFPVVVYSSVSIGILKQAIYPNITVDSRIKSKDLELWRVVDAKEDDKGCVDLDGTIVKSELKNPRQLLSELDELTGPTTFVFIKLPKRESKRQREDDEPDTSRKSPKHESQEIDKIFSLVFKKINERDAQGDSASKKIHIEDQWEKYTAIDGISVDLPTAWVKILKGKDSQPAPRKEFADLKGDLQAGQRIVIPSMGEIPKDFKKYSSDSRLFITEQMLRLWDEIKSPQQNAYRRVLSGPMGVGKSFLSYFLAAKAYAEGWITLYIPDAGVLDKDTIQRSEFEIVKRFLVLNKDILTSNDWEKLATAYNRFGNSTVEAIFTEFLMQPTNERKALTTVDEHGALFKDKPSIPEKYKSLAYLDKLSRWRDDYVGSRLIFTGTQHAKFELKYMEDSFKFDRQTVEFVGPLSKDVFLKLLDAAIEANADMEDSIHLDPEEIERIVEITNCVPRELMYLCDILRKIPDLSTGDAFLRYETERMGEFEAKADEYLREIQNEPISYSNFYRGLAQAFLYGSVKEHFKWKFIDLGLLYRLRRSGETLFRPLCPATKKALLEVFKKMKMPTELKSRLLAGNLTGNEFEIAFFYALICAQKPVMLKSTDVNGERENVIKLDFDDYAVMSRADIHSLGQTKDTHLSRGYENYPRFDFMIGPIFIQVSVSEFADHNTGSQDFKAFVRPYRDIFSNLHAKNQIECYLDHMYGGDHTANIDTRGRFIVTRKDPSKGDIPVVGFRIVYICGRDIPLKNHPRLVKELADVAHISFNELKDSLFANIH
ncbi:hypothetical protein BGZ76_007422 [Entomortierella beljakovae]|nr:hypothetical protein BGZ76_007422 [Entomortierella beljakovae]